MTETPETTVRPATAADADAIAAIYNEAVLGSTATFDLEPVTAAQRAEWLAEHDAAHPVIVAEADGEVVAWGSLSAVSDRGAWDSTVEISTYVTGDRVSTGLGTLLGTELERLAREAGHHVIMARICAENVASIHLAERLCYRRVGTLREVGRKFGRWLDVVILEKRL